MQRCSQYMEQRREALTEREAREVILRGIDAQCNKRSPLVSDNNNSHSSIKNCCNLRVRTFFLRMNSLYCSLGPVRIPRSPKSGTPTNRSTAVPAFCTSIGWSLCASGYSRGTGVDFALCVSRNLCFYGIDRNQ